MTSRTKAKPNPSVEEFIAGFWDRVEVGEITDCWEWSHGRDYYDYGHLRWPSAWGSGSVKAHRLAYSISHPDVDASDMDGMAVCHSCDNPPCCNPAHLWLGTRTDNHRDMERKGRHVAGRDIWPGDVHPNMKLAEEQVRFVREAYGSWNRSGTSARALAKQCGVSTSCMSNAVNRRTYAWVA